MLKQTCRCLSGTRKADRLPEAFAVGDYAGGRGGRRRKGSFQSRDCTCRYKNAGREIAEQPLLQISAHLLPDRSVCSQCFTNRWTDKIVPKRTGEKVVADLDGQAQVRKKKPVDATCLSGFWACLEGEERGFLDTQEVCFLSRILP